MKMKTKAKKCPYCGGTPLSFQAPVATKGCTMNLHIVECDADEDGDCSKTPFIEHRLTVYGETKEQAIERWNEAVSR